MIYVIYLLLIIVLLVLFSLLIEKRKTTVVPSSANTKSQYTYKKKTFLTKSEQDFFNKIKELENEINIRIVPQINLGSIITKIGNFRYYRSELFRNVDFGILDSKYEKILLLVELNDRSHLNKKRMIRDRKVKSICDCAGIKLITFYTSYPNQKDYVKNRIKESLNLKKSDNNS